jgi:peptide/nickel transport system substrate-binding protein
MKKLSVLVAILLALALILGACTSTTQSTTPPPSSTTQGTIPTTPAVTTTSAAPPSSTTSPAATSTAAPAGPKRGGTLVVVFANSVNPVTGWPVAAPGGPIQFSQLVMESLLREENTGTIYPWLAESYKVADDLKSITFVLRKGIKFHDGSDFNAQVVKWNLENFVAAHKTPNWASIEIIDDYTVRLNLNNWSNTVLSDLADSDSGFGYMVSKAAYDAHGGGKDSETWMKLNPVGTGPFKFVSYQMDVAFKVVKNPDYWKKDANGNQLPYLDGVTIMPIADPNTRLMTIKSGTGDMVFAYLGKETADYAAIGMTIKTPVNGNICLTPDTANADSPWAKQQVREAIEYAIDKVGIATAFGYGFWQAPYQFQARGSAAYDDKLATKRGYDPVKAKQLLTEAGYPDGFTTSIIVFGGDTNKNAALAIQANLDKIGIKVNLEFPEMGKYFDYYLHGWKNGALMGPIITYANFNSGIATSAPGSPAFASWARSPNFVAAYTASIASPSPDVKLIQKMTGTWITEASRIAVSETGGGYATHPYVMDLGWNTRSSASFMNYESCWLDK